MKFAFLQTCGLMESATISQGQQANIAVLSAIKIPPKCAASVLTVIYMKNVLQSSIPATKCQ